MMLEATVHDREVFRKVNVHKILKALETVLAFVPRNS